MDIILEDMNEEHIELIKMALDNAMGHTTFDLTSKYDRLKDIRESLSDFSASLMTDDEVEQINQDVNKYGLNDLLQLKLKQKKFTVITESKENWPAELLQNPCQILTADLLNTSNMFKNKLKVEFKNCDNKTIGSVDGISSIKEFEPGMREALEVAAKQIPMSAPVEKSITLKKEETPNQVEIVKKYSPLVAETKKAQIVPAPKTEATASQKAEVYSNGSLTLTKIFLTNGEFILVNPNNSVPYATFKPSTKKEVYRVKLDDGTSTLGYLEDGNIVVELANSDGSFRKEIFTIK